MNTLRIKINIADNIVEFNMKLSHQNLYFFNQGSDKGKEDWIKSYLKNKISVLSIEKIKEEL